MHCFSLCTCIYILVNVFYLIFCSQYHYVFARSIIFILAGRWQIVMDFSVSLSFFLSVHPYSLLCFGNSNGLSLWGHVSGIVTIVIFVIIFSLDTEPANLFSDNYSTYIAVFEKPRLSVFVIRVNTKYFLFCIGG